MSILKPKTKEFPLGKRKAYKQSNEPINQITRQTQSLTQSAGKRLREGHN